jgi:hypothetical protein
VLRCPQQILIFEAFALSNVGAFSINCELESASVIISSFSPVLAHDDGERRARLF